MATKNYKEFLNWVDCKKWNEICSQVFDAKVLNESSNRMTKEKWVLAGLQLSNHATNIDWVDCYDYDLRFFGWNHAKVEVKTGNHPIFSAVQGKMKDFVTLKMKNIYESRYDRTSLDKDFDYLMIVQLSPVFAIAFTDYKTVCDHLVQLKDGFLTKIPSEKLDIIYKEPSAGLAEREIDFDPKSVIIKQLKEAGY